MKKTGMYFFSKFLVFIAGVVLGYFIFAEHGLFIHFSGKDNGHIVQDGVVADAKTAVKIAKAVWKPMYGGKDLILRKYEVILDEQGIWTIEGRNSFFGVFLFNGGGPYMRIDGNTGSILAVSHTK
jgi:hypothetical protein